MFTINQVAERLNCSVALVYQLCANGRLAHHRLGIGRGTIRITEEALQELLEQTRVAPQSLKTAAGLRHIRLRHQRVSV